MMNSVIVVCTMLTLVYCSTEEAGNQEELFTDVARRKSGLGFHHGYNGLWQLFGFQALTVLYWLKVKALIVAFFVGAATFWGFKYFFFKKPSCHDHVIGDGYTFPFEEGISWSSGPGHDHVPYSLEHSSHHADVDPTYEPYSGYSSYSESPGPTDGLSEQRQFESEDKIAEFMFLFLGVNSEDCRRRFMCEVEFKSKNSPITKMAFNIVGRGIFSKYINKGEESNQRALSFEDCEHMYPQCTVIEEDVQDEQAHDNSR